MSGDRRLSRELSRHYLLPCIAQIVLAIELATRFRLHASLKEAEQPLGGWVTRRAPAFCPVSRALTRLLPRRPDTHPVVRRVEPLLPYVLK